MKPPYSWKSTIVTLGTVVLVVAVSSAPLVAYAEEPIGQGKFTGKSGHVASGTVVVSKSSSGTVVILENDFNFDGAPDPKLGFGRNGYDPNGKFSALKSNSGKQVYQVPATIDATKYNEVWVWCEQYNVPLGVATIR